MTKVVSIYIIITERRDDMKNKIVIYGGSFNPPLNSHFSIAQQVINDCEEVEKIVFVPVNQIYSKKGLIDNEHRIAMLNLVIQKNDSFELSDIDMHSDHSLYMIEIMNAMHEKYSGRLISFLVGSDNLKDVSHWKNAEELLKNYQILVMERDNDSVTEIIGKDDILKKYRANILVLKQDIKSNYSSTYVREQIKQRKSVKYLMPDEIYEYVKQNHLYE